MRLLIMGPPGVGKGTQAVGVAAHIPAPAHPLERSRRTP